MLKSKNKIIGITLGDPCGVGPEITAQALSRPDIQRLGHFVIIGDYFVMEHFPIRNLKNCTFLDVNLLPKNKWKLGKPSLESGQASLEYLKTSVELIQAKKIDALVTGPLSKEWVSFSLPGFHGHTEYLAEAFGVKNVEMLFVAGTWRVIIATRHIPLSQVPTAVTRKNLGGTIAMTHHILKSMFKIKDPQIAVCGLNPHAGEGGRIGKEDIKVVLPAILAAQKQKMKICGPFAADTLFVPHNAKKYDAIISLYHDQGLGPIKALFFPNLVNLTIGLPFIRTSTAHGTAFDIAGKNMADPASMCEAIKLAFELSS
ncbi:MAG: 4-hydroxythreonine-4-phosphate dehydrogenase PdxA [Candidatus Omnitrophica bacterium]|nr:4-hydroxythreonine-4-phosphate dehydrogenase PdxA [Candidatus Omnitrophota bacterium]